MNIYQDMDKGAIFIQALGPHVKQVNKFDIQIIINKLYNRQRKKDLQTLTNKQKVDKQICRQPNK